MTTEHPNTYRVCIWPNGDWCHADDREQFEYSRPANDSTHQIVLIVLPGDDPQTLLQDYVDAEVKRLQA
jgi:hypothetical protein